MDRYRESYVSEMQAFVDAVMDDHETPVTGQDGRDPAVLGAAAKESHETGRPVRVEEFS